MNANCIHTGFLMKFPLHSLMLSPWQIRGTGPSSLLTLHVLRPGLAWSSRLECLSGSQYSSPHQKWDKSKKWVLPYTKWYWCFYWKLPALILWPLKFRALLKDEQMRVKRAGLKVGESCPLRLNAEGREGAVCVHYVTINKYQIGKLWWKNLKSIQ